MAMTASAVGHQVKERASTAATQEDAIADEPSAGVPSLEGQSPGGSGIGICCSGGGIRSAAFNLGALQALSAAGVYQQADFVTCVSGGSYIAASFATVAHGPRFDGEHADVVCPQAPDYAYAPQSPEEQRLRNQSHYLFPRLAVTVRGVIWMLFGLLANLGLLLVFVFVGARPLGENFLEVYHRPRTGIVTKLRGLASGLLVASLVAGVLMLAMPAVTVGLQRLALSNRPDPTTARVLAGMGFATPSGCAAAARERPNGACGARRPPVAGANGLTPAPPRPGASSPSSSPCSRSSAGWSSSPLGRAGIWGPSRWRTRRSAAVCPGSCTGSSSACGRGWAARSWSGRPRC